jgi:predicted transposase YbfD/YdcC
MNVFENLISHMDNLEDPRVLSRSDHKLIDIMVISVIAIIAHAESWYEIADFANAKQEWFEKFLELPNGVPSHDTFSRVFGMVDPKKFEECFMNWVKEVRERVADDTIAIDGKVSGGTVIKALGNRKDCLTTVSAWSTLSGVVLGQLKANGSGSSEVSAAKELLEFLDIEGMTIVADAGIGRESTVRKIREKKGNYVVPVKGNTTGFITKLENLFAGVDQTQIEEARLREVGHGRNESRTVTIIRKEHFSKDLNANRDGSEKWEDLSVVGRVVYESIEKDNRPANMRNKTETRYFISNLDGSAELLSEKIRLQWSIENQLHWILDVSMGKDSNRTRNKIAAENLATVRKIAINLVKKETSKKKSVRAKLKLAGWDHNYLELILFKKKLV